VLPIALAGVSAQAADAMTFHPMNATDLFNDVATANSTPGMNVIDLSDVQYFPSATQNMTITGNLEITGLPQLQPAQFVNGFAPDVNAQNQAGDGFPLFTIAAGANVIFKGFNVDTGGGGTWPLLSDAGGNLELDNMAVYGSIGDNLDISAASSNKVVINNSYFTTSHGQASIDNFGSAGTALTLNNDTIAGNLHAGVSGPFVSHNDVFATNSPDCDPPGTTSDVTSEDEDFSCNVTYSGTPAIQAGANNGGPTFTGAPASNSDLLTTDTATQSWCEKSDQRFFTAPTGATCIIGSYQPNYTLQSDTAGPVCTVDFKDSGPGFNPNEMQVHATDSGVAGIGSDAISNQTIELKNTTTTNGTVSSANVPGTLWDETTPGSNILGEPSSGTAYPVLAQKPSGDTTAGDTFWSFTATDWFNNQTQCQ